MNGLGPAAASAKYPDIAVLLTTGYSSSVQDAVRQGFEVLKPYGLAALERTCGTACCDERATPALQQQWAD